MNRITIRRIEVIRAANVAAVLYFVGVLVFGLLFFAPFSLLVGVAGISRGDGAAGAVLGAGIVGTLLFVAFGAVFYAIIGWIATAIGCALYNFVAGRVGGIRVVVDIEGPTPGYGGGYGNPAYGNPNYAVPPGYQPGYGSNPPAGWPPQGS